MEIEEGSCRVVFKLQFREGEQAAVVAACGTRKHANGHWKYNSEQAFVHATGQPWASMPLKEFQNAKARAGVDQCPTARYYQIALFQKNRAWAWFCFR